MRHGPRTKLTGTFSGSINPSLNARGQVRKPRAAARALSHYPIDLCYFSPQRRAKETVLPSSIVAHPKAFVKFQNPLLKEIRFGQWEGLRFSEVEAKWPSLAKAWAKNPLKVRVPEWGIFSISPSPRETVSPS